MKKLAYVVLAAGLAGLAGCAGVEKKEDNLVKLATESQTDGRFYKESSLSVDLGNPDSKEEKEVPTNLKYSVRVFRSGRDGLVFREYITDVEGTLPGADGKRPVVRRIYGVLFDNSKVDSCYEPTGCFDDGKQKWKKVDCSNFGVKEGQ